jgi:large subunit ribosomal protein L13
MKATKLNYKIERKPHQIDGTGQSVGRLATQIAILLRGKHKPSFTPQVDNGDFVIVSNLDKLKFTGKKLEQKMVYRHSHFPGGIKKIPAKKIYKDNPSQILINAVFKMLPKNKLRNAMIKRLTIK